ncbi:hypothetical protein FKP32DRAFT_1550013, partial [Trametes sanguinea]
RLARNIWPENIGQIVQERELSVASLPSSRKIPDNLEDLAEWLWVDRQDHLSQALVYLYDDVDGVDASASVELVVRVQGVIADMNVSLSGTWDGTELNAKKANQYLTLVSGGCTAAFEPQVRCLNTLRDAVLAQLGKCDDRQRGRQDALVFRRRVFTKVRYGVNDHIPSAIVNSEDPRAKFKAIEKSWKVVDKLRAGTQLAHGEIFSVTPLSLRKGDLVDVSARVVVAFTRGPQGRRYELSFEPMLIVRLASA